MSTQARSLDPETVWHAFRDQLVGFVRGRVVSDDDTEDIVQEVFARVQASSGSTDIENVSGWIFQITRNAIIDYHRARAKSGRIESALQHDPEPDPPESEPPDATAEMSRCLRPFVAQLPAAYAEALTLTDLGGMSQTEAARQLGLSTSGMKSRVQRGRARLRTLVLECCEVELDARRRVVDYRSRSPTCGTCG